MAEVYFKKAKQVASSLIIQCNGTQKINWNGSAAATLNITPSIIGAAAASHNHSASNITSGTLSLSRGGTGGATANAANYNIFKDATKQDAGFSDNTLFAYFTAVPSTATGAIYKYKAVDMYNDWLKGKISASYAAKSHTHNYAGSSSAGGAANSAVKLHTARYINGIAFNGTANINISNMYAESLSGKTISLNNLNLKDGRPWIKYYYCPTDGGGSNITGRPDDNNKRAFYLKIELIRYSSTTDYICKQTYVSGYNVSTYVRYCNNGTWTRWMLEPKLLYGKSLPSSGNKEGDIFLLYS